MEGDIITLQDIFVFDYSAGFDEHGRSLGGLRATGLRPEVPGEDDALQRARRPAALRDGRHAVTVTTLVLPLAASSRT